MIRVTVWNEFYHEKNDPRTAAVYPDGLHMAIKRMLECEDVTVRTATLDDPECGLTEEVLADTDVLVWWGHVRHHLVPDEVAKRVQMHVLSGMGLIVLLLVINVMMAVGHYPMPQGVSLAGLCLPVVGALAVTLGLNPIVVCLPVCMSTSMLLLVPIDPTCFTTYSGGYWKIKDMMSSGILITIGYILVSSLWTAVIAATGALG